MSAVDLPSTTEPSTEPTAGEAAGPAWFDAHLEPELRGGVDRVRQWVPPHLQSLPVAERRLLADALVASLPDDLPAGVTWHAAHVRGWDGDPEVPVRVYLPSALTTPGAGAAPAVLHVHGGGLWGGTLAADHAAAGRLAHELGAVVVSVGYRLAPEHPYPAALRDCSAALGALTSNARELALPLAGVDPRRVALHGPSAGGGLVLATALRARDEGTAAPCAVAAIYPMLDDRCRTPSSHQVVGLGPAVWDRAANLEAWAWYLAGSEPDDDGWAVPARARDLAGLPPTYLEVGELDLFRDEVLCLASRLCGAGVPVELHLLPGAFHGSDAVAPEAPSSRAARAARLAWLRHRLAAVDPPSS